MLIASHLPKISIGLSTDAPEKPKIIEPDVPVDTKLEMHEKSLLNEKQIELEMKKQELNHFYGSKAFQLMKNLSNQVIKKFIKLGETEYDEEPYFPWIKEYKRFVAKLRDEDSDSRMSKRSYSLTEDMNRAKKKEWWYRQKYKLMKALKLKWDQSYKETYDIVMKSNNEAVKKKFRDIDYNQLENTTISFEKIPLLKIDSYIDNTDKMTSDTTGVANFEISKRTK